MEKRRSKNKDISSCVYAGAGAMVGLHSFFALSIAISLGPQQGRLSMRQFLLGSIMALGGTVIGLIQLRWGSAIRQGIDATTRAEQADVVVGIHEESARLILVELPYVLLLFWSAIWVWLFFAF